MLHSIFFHIWSYLKIVFFVPKQLGGIQKRLILLSKINMNCVRKLNAYVKTYLQKTRYCYHVVNTLLHVAMLQCE
jgi:hypothetical protein